MKKVLLFMGVFFIMMTILTGCSRADKYYDNARKSFLTGDYEKAAQSFSAAVTANPNRADYYINYGLALTALGKYEEAIAQFDLAYMDKDMLIIRENDKRALRGKGITFYHMLQYDKAVEAFQAALKINELPDINMDILYYMADALIKSGAYDEAADAYSDIISRDGKAAQAYGQRAYCYQYLGLYEQSLADYERAISLEPGNYEYYFGEYYLMKDSNNKAGASEVLSRAEKLQADADIDKYNLARLHYLQGNYDTALVEFKACESSGFSEADYYIGEIYRDKKDYANAVYYYENYINSGAVSVPAVYNQAAVCLINTGSCQEALEYLEQGLEYNNSGMSKILMRNEIITYEYLGRFDDAKEKMKEYLVDYPEDTQALKEAGFIDTRVTAQE
jgi:tetratricopeptide (TPR) repeat protein